MKPFVLFPKLSFRLVLVLAFYGVSVISLLMVVLFSNYYYSKETEKQFGKISYEAIVRLNYHMDYYFNHFRQSTKTLIESDTVQDWFINGGDTYEDVQNVEYELRRYMALNFSEIQGIFLVAEDHSIIPMAQYFGTLNHFENEPWYGVPLASEMKILPTHVGRYEGANGQSFITIVLPVFNKLTLKLIGNLVIDISLSEVSHAFQSSKLGHTGDFFVLSPDYETIIYHPNEEWNSRAVEETDLAQLNFSDDLPYSVQSFLGKNYLVANYPAALTGWRTVSIIRLDEMAAGLSAARTSVLYVLGIIALLILLFVPVLSNRFVQPILTLKNLMNQVAKGSLKMHSSPINGRDEFLQLFRSFNFMVSQLDELIRTNTGLQMREIQMQLQQKNATIKALQNQINPHLLYNSLGIIKSIAYLEEVPMIERLAQNLSDVYRYTAKFSSLEVSLREELSILRKYLEIIHIRFPKHFHSKIYINDKFLDCRVIKLSLQPIVENAVKYAVEARGGESSIIVSAYQEGSDLVIEIADNGSGIEPEKLSEINDQICGISEYVEDLEQSQSALGIVNVHARLVLKYGRDYGISLTSFIGRGTVISIRVPYKVESLES